MSRLRCPPPPHGSNPYAPAPLGRARGVSPLPLPPLPVVPVRQVSIDPAKDQHLAYFTEQFSGFDCVDNESGPDIPACDISPEVPPARRRAMGHPPPHPRPRPVPRCYPLKGEAPETLNRSLCFETRVGMAAVFLCGKIHPLGNVQRIKAAIPPRWPHTAEAVGGLCQSKHNVVQCPFYLSLESLQIWTVYVNPRSVRGGSSRRWLERIPGQLTIQRLS